MSTNALDFEFKVGFLGLVALVNLGSTSGTCFPYFAGTTAGTGRKARGYADFTFATAPST